MIKNTILRPRRISYVLIAVLFGLVGMLVGIYVSLQDYWRLEGVQNGSAGQLRPGEYGPLRSGSRLFEEPFFLLPGIFQHEDPFFVHPAELSLQEDLENWMNVIDTLDEEGLRAEADRLMDELSAEDL